MSSFINKAKDKIEATLEKNSNKNDNTHTGGYGTHSNTTADSSLGGYGNTQPQDQYGTTGATSGMAATGNYGSNPGYDDPRPTNDGAHSSNLMNKTDPRVDSNRHGRSDPTSRYGGVGNTQTQGDNFGQPGTVGDFGATDTGYGASTGTHTTGHTGVGAHGAHSSTGPTSNVGYTGGSNTYDDPRSTNTGPHDSTLMNKADPRFDSDFDNRSNPTSRVGGYGGQTDTFNTGSGDYGSTTTGNTGYGSRTGNTGYTGGTNTYDDSRSANVGLHKSNAMNKLDPRVDSNVDNRGDPTSRVGGYGGQTDVQGSYGTTGGYGMGSTTGAPGYGSGSTQAHEATTTGHGTHQSHGARSAYGAQDTYGDSSFTPGSGNAQKTAGPHNSDMMNKIDPRVDSDLDGSKTYGGNRTNY